MPAEASPAVIEAGAEAASAVVDNAGQVQAAPAVQAKLYGEAIEKLPTDLYIPPDALSILLDQFEGPLDLLLYLIRKQNFDIFDIPLAQVTLQFMAYVEEIKERNLEMAAEYLVMSAMLIQIKSRMLLPQEKTHGIDGEELDPRAELVRKLLEYEQMKEAAGHLGAMPVAGRDIFAVDVPVQKNVANVLPSVCPDDLKRAWAEVLNRAKLERKHHISREELSVREHMSIILRKLKDAKFVEFNEMFDIAGGVPVVVVHFVAMLELAKETLVEITQAEPFAPIYIRMAASSA